MSMSPSPSLTNNTTPQGGRERTAVPAVIFTNRIIPRIVAGIMFLVAVVGFSSLYPRLGTEELNLPSMLDGFLREGTHRLAVLNGSDRALLGELVVSIDHEENYNLVIEGSFGPHGQSAISINGEFSQYRYLQKLNVRVIEPGAALELLWNFDGDRIANLIVTEANGPQQSRLAFPAPILLRDIGEKDYAIVSPIVLQKLLANLEGLVVVRDLLDGEQSDFAQARSISLVHIIRNRLEQLAPLSSEESKVGL